MKAHIGVLGAWAGVANSFLKHSLKIRSQVDWNNKANSECAHQACCCICNNKKCLLVRGDLNASPSCSSRVFGRLSHFVFKRYMHISGFLAFLPCYFAEHDKLHTFSLAQTGIWYFSVCLFWSFLILQDAETDAMYSSGASKIEERKGKSGFVIIHSSKIIFWLLVYFMTRPISKKFWPECPWYWRIACVTWSQTSCLDKHVIPQSRRAKPRRACRLISKQYTHNSRLRKQLKVPSAQQQ